MAVHYITENSIVVGTGLDLSSGDHAYVMSGVLLASTTTNGIYGGGSLHIITIAGAVSSPITTISLGDNSLLDSGNRLHVLTGAIVTSTSGIGVSILGVSSLIDNYGTIGGNYGARLTGDNSVLNNHGHIYAELGSAVTINTLGSNAGSATTLNNFGTISSAHVAIFGDVDFQEIIRNFGSVTGLIEQGNGDNRFYNDGLINGEIRSGTGSDIIVNSGQIVGNVHTGAGNDIVDNRNGTITGSVLLGEAADQFDGRGGTVSGTVSGDAGNDTFIGNATSADVFDGGVDKDTLDFRTQGAVVLALDNNFDPGGAALGDEYTGFENIFGSRGGNDLLRGDGAANTLYGLGGADQIDGAGGHDFLRGATGIDALTGGLGNDAFAYGALNEIGDTISDFSSVAAGNNDVFRITASAFGGGLVAGTLAANQFQTRADNVAQDGDDRFIFRTTDKTLWFDADGNGLTSAAVMVADLQASATMTNLDILVV